MLYPKPCYKPVYLFYLDPCTFHIEMRKLPKYFQNNKCAITSNNLFHSQENQTILGVMGIDVTTADMQKKEPKRKVKLLSNIYPFLRLHFALLKNNKKKKKKKYDICGGLLTPHMLSLSLMNLLRECWRVSNKDYLEFINFYYFLWYEAVLHYFIICYLALGLISWN